MKKTFTTLIAVIVMLLVYSNETIGSSNSNLSSITSTEVAPQHDHQNETIALNNGQKWIVDNNMMVHIRNMEKDINSFESKNSNDYSILSKKLKSNIELLTSNCTMKGQAHDELHKWLLPYIDLVKEFSASKSDKQSVVNFEKIKKSFVTFNTYFK